MISVIRLPLKDGYKMYFNRGKSSWVLHYKNKYVAGSTMNLKFYGTHEGGRAIRVTVTFYYSTILHRSASVPV